MRVLWVVLDRGRYVLFAEMHNFLMHVSTLRMHYAFLSAAVAICSSWLASIVCVE